MLSRKWANWFFFSVRMYVSQTKWKKLGGCEDELKFRPIVLFSKPRMTVFERIFYPLQVQIFTRWTRWSGERGRSSTLLMGGPGPAADKFRVKIQGKKKQKTIPEIF